MLDDAEVRVWTARFGVTPEQVKKDHLISHVLNAIAKTDAAERVVFFGGTALARTHLPDRRMSEDVDLWAESRSGVLDIIAESLPRALRREFPRIRVDNESASTRSVTAADGTRLRLQVVEYGSEYWKCVPLEHRRIDLRYKDLANPVEYRVPTLASFTAMKHLAWTDRKAPRDLVDLAGLAAMDALNSEADSVVACLRGSPVRKYDVDSIPDSTRRAWDFDLANQMRAVPDADQAIQDVRSGWARGLGWE